jgi:signal recognition particle receptor subunit beta
MDDVDIKDMPQPGEAPLVHEAGSEDIIKEKVVHEENFSDGLKDVNPDNTIPILVGVAVGVLTLLLIYLFTKRRSLGRDVLITGICDSGKTTILSQLVSGKTRQTYTSMNHNRFSLPVDSKAAVELVDVPGSDRVRGQVIDEFSGSARAVVFVVDSNTVSKQVRDVAEYLHFLLTNKNIHSNSPPLLIVCNKQDSGMAKSSGAVQALLEKEIEKVRMTRSNQLAGTQNESRDSTFLGKEGKTFELRDLGCKVDFEEASALELDSLKGVRQWISDIA